MSKIRIVSGGTPMTTEIFAIDEVTGVEIKLTNVVTIDFKPMNNKDEIEAKLGFVNIEFDIVAKV